MPLSRIVSQAMVACCVVAAFAAGEAVAQGMTPLRVDPTLLGMPPVEKKVPAPAAKKAEPVAPAETTAPAERPRAEVKAVDPSAVEAKPLTEGAVDSPPAAERKKTEPKPSARAESPDRIPAQAVAPSPPAEPAVAEPAPAPVPAQTGVQAVAAPAPRPREETKVVSRAPAAASAPPSAGGKITTLAPLSVHPGLLGLPAPAVAGGAPRSGKATASAAAAGVAPSTVAAIEKNVDASWRSGQPPMLGFHGEPLELPEGAAGSPTLKTAKALQPIQSSGMPLPMFLTADDLAGVTDHETVATGSVEARKAGSVVNADRMIYRPVEDQLEAIGNVSLLQNDDLVSGPHMRLNMGSQTGFFVQPNYMFKREAKWALKERERLSKGEKGSTVLDSRALSAWNAVAARQSRPEEGSLMNVLGVSSEVADDIPKSEAHGVAERMDFEGDNKYRLFNNTYTTCKPGDNSWYVKTDELELDYDREVAEGKGGTVYFKDTPIFYSPWLSFSLNNQRKSGFLTPTFGTSSVNGMMVSVPYYWNIAPNMDATFAPRYFSKRGLLLASEFRYVDRDYSGNLRGEILPSDNLDNGNRRYAYSLMHRQTFGLGVSGALNISGVSDGTYLADLGARSVVTAQRQLLRQGILAYGGGWWSARLIGQSFQTLNPDRLPENQIEHVYSFAPRVVVNARRPDYFGADLTFAGQYTSFLHRDANSADPSKRKDEGRRFVAYPQVALPFVQPGWYVTPKVGAHVTHYSIDRNVPGTLGDPGSITRSLPIVSVDSGMTFERDTSWFGARATQTLEPRLYYLYVPYRDQSRIPVFDSGVADFNFAQIFSENQFSGYDRVSDAHQLTAAVVTRLIDPTSGAEAMRAMFGQRYYFRRQQVTLPGATLRAAAVDKWNRSDFLAAFSGRVLPKTFLDAALQYNPSDARMERSSIGMRYQPDFGRVLNASYRFGSKEIAGGTAFKNFDVAGQWPIWGGLSAVGRYNYSILDHKPVETVGGLEYSEGCWAIRVVGHQVATTTGKSNKSLFVQLELTDFARIGSNPIDLLRRNITGYGLSSQPVADPVFGE